MKRNRDTLCFFGKDPNRSGKKKGVLIMLFTVTNDLKERSLAEELFLTYKDKMYGIALAILKNAPDAEDAVMDAALSIVKNISLFSPLPRNKRESLIVIIARNTAINRYRKNKRGKTVFFDEAYENMPDNEPTPEELFIMDESYDVLLGEIMSLEPLYRDIIVMKFLYDRDNKTIADLLGIAESTVRVRLWRAKALLENIRNKN